MIRAKAIAVVFVLVVMAGYAAHGEDQAKVGELSQQQLGNMGYKVEDATGGVAWLRDGKFRDKPAEPGAATCLEIRLFGPVAHGDLDGDGTPDAAVLLASDPGGSGTFIDLAVVVNEKGRPKHVASVNLGDRVKILSLAIKDRIVTVELLTQGPGDPMSEPTKRERRSYLLKMGKLVKV